HEPIFVPGGIAYIQHRLGGRPDRIAFYDGRTSHVIYSVKEGAVQRLASSRTGHILFNRTAGTIGVWARPFSPRRKGFVKSAFLVAPCATSPSVSRSGTLAYSLQWEGSSGRLAWVDHGGRIMRYVTETLDGVGQVSVSPDFHRA